MNTRNLKSGVAALALIVSAGAAADGVYKSTDADGNVQYGDRPSGAPTEEVVQLTYNRTSPASAESRRQSVQDRVAEQEKARADRLAARQAADEERAAAAERQEKCVKTRAQLKQMLEARRVYRENADGEREYLDDAARAEARSKAEALVAEYCD